MSLDFTALNNIPLHIAKKDFTEPISHEEGNLALKLEKPATGQNTAPQGELVHSHRLDQEKQERERTREMYATYQENIKRAGSLRADLLKGIQRGEDPLALLLKAVECISLMTGDTVIYEQGKADMLAVYGWGLGKPEPLRKELENAQQRLKRLRGATVPPEAEARLNNAIRSHEELILSLQGAIARANDEEGHNSPKPVSSILAEVMAEIRDRQGAQYE